MIHILDFGLSNLGSIENALRRAGYPSSTCSTPDSLEKATTLIIPGVGAFDEAVSRLKNQRIWELLQRKARVEKIPILGICLGLQLMTHSSEEGLARGLGWLEARTTRLQANSLPLPHIGWRTLNYSNAHHPLVRGLDSQSRFYFVHSYRLQCEAASPKVLASAEYGCEFPAVVCQENLVGVQFHPEKSHDAGQLFLHNFLSHYRPVS